MRAAIVVLIALANIAHADVERVERDDEVSETVPPASFDIR